MVETSSHSKGISDSVFVAGLLGIPTSSAVALPFIEFASHNLKVQVKETGTIVPMELKPAQLDLYPKLTGRDLIVKARQLGMSTFIQALQFRRVAFEPCLAATLAHDSNTTNTMRRMHRRFYDNLPEAMKPERSIDNATQIAYPATNSLVTLTTAGSPTSGIGAVYHHVHGTEIAKWKDAESIMSNLIQGVPANGTIVFESTPDGARGWFYERCMEALDGDSPWTIHFYPWWWEPKYRLLLDEGEVLDLSEEEKRLVSHHELTMEQIKWRRAKVKELPYTFKQEYPEDVRQCFLSDGNSVFGEFEHCLLTRDEMEEIEYIEGHRYMAGVDWGQENDYTTLSIIDATDDIEVFIGRWRRMPWDEMQNRIVANCAKWHVETIQPEKNSMGTVNIENMDDKFIDAGVDITRRSITMDNRKKQKLVSNLYDGIHNAGLKLQDVDYATSELRTFISNQLESGKYRFEHMDGAHDDTVIARMLAWDCVCKMI